MAKHKCHERGHCIRCGERWPCTARRIREARAAAVVPSLERGRNRHFALIAAIVRAIGKHGPMDEDDLLDRIFVHEAEIAKAIHGAIVVGRVRIDGAGMISMPPDDERIAPTGNDDLEPLRVPMRLVARTR